MRPSPVAVAVNQAFLMLVQHEINQGNINRIRSLGLSDDIIVKLQRLQPSQLSKLTYSPALWGTVVIDLPVLTRLVSEFEDAKIDRAIMLGATSAMMLEVFGITHSETAHRRRVLGIDTKRGRKKVLSDDESAALWQCWKTAKSLHNRPLGECFTELMDIAESLNISLANVWQEVSGMISEGAEAGAD